MTSDDLEQIGNVATQIADVAVQISTGGLVGVDKDGLERGASLRGVDETVGELTGRNQARKANMEAKDALNEEKAAKKKQIADEQKRKDVQDIQASQYAASVRATAEAVRNKSLGGSGATTPSTDFLGL